MSTTALKNGSVIASMLTQYASGINKNKNWEGDKILVVGSIFSNRGDQAMTFTAVDQLSRRFPEKDCVLFTIKPEQIHNPSEYEFEVVSLDATYRARSLNTLGKFSGVFGPPLFKKFDQIWKDAAFAVDINGYALSSQTGVEDTLGYLLTLMTADEYEVPYYILPQSIGPFNYRPIEHVFLDPLLRRYIEIPELIFPREDHGVEALRRYTNRHIEQSSDIVLQHGEYDLNNIFVDPPKIDVPQFENPTVGIVPNARVASRVDEQELIEMYKSIGEVINGLDYQLTIFAHTTSDRKLCELIHDAIGFGELLDTPYNAIELEHIINQLDFIIGSRYHSIIHAYKCGVPAVVIGWAVKYKELLRRFDQLEYHFDCRFGLAEKEIVDAVNELSLNSDKEETVIKNTLDEVRAESVFDRIKTNIESNQ